MTARASVEVGAVRAVTAELPTTEVQLLSFPPGHRHPPFELERGYVAVVLAGAVAKSFSRDSWTLVPATAGLLAAGATHGSDFGPAGATVVTVRPDDRVGAIRRAAPVPAPALLPLARRLAVELRAADACWSLAAEGLALQLLAAAGRARAAPTRSGQWLGDAVDLLRARAPETASLSELADAVGVHPVHLARSFRARFGVSVGEYARTLRLEWAAQRLAHEDAPLAEIAAGAGFADQSHFTRAFRRHAGTTPGRYRALLRR